MSYPRGFVPERLPTATRREVLALALSMGALFVLLGGARFATFHNQTFDLAFYTRLAWGIVHGNYWEPMVNAHMYGLHLSPILAPIAVLGWLSDTAWVLIVAQALALALAAFPLARIGAAHLGSGGAIAGAVAWLLYPNLGHVAGYEVHPGTIAALPLAWMAYAIDRRRPRVFVWASLGVLLCREDLALVVIAAAALYAWRDRTALRTAVAVAGAALLYAGFFFFYLHPLHAPQTGSLELHFGRFGDSLGEVALYLLTHPLELAGHLATVDRALYLPKILAPLLLLPLLRPSWLLPALPILAINLVSDWPTTTDLDVHYLTPTLPFLVAGALEGATRLPPAWRAHAPTALIGASLVAHAIAGGTPFAYDYPREAFTPDRNTAASRAVLEGIGPTASAQAPYALLPHLAERDNLYRTTSPERNADFYVLDVSHRREYAGDEDLIRTVEEPPVRDWLARDDHGLVVAEGDYLLLRRGLHPREGLGGRAIVGRVDPGEGVALTACLAVRGARLEGTRLSLDLVARGPCPHDLAVRIGVVDRPPRVDLLFAGWLNPVHLRRGDRLRSDHRLSEAQARAIRERGLRLGAIRQSGARPEHDDPNSVEVPLDQLPSSGS